MLKLRETLAIVVVASLLSFGFPGRQARANAPAMMRTSGVLGAPPGDGRTPLVVERESIDIDCVERGGEPHCTFEARYHIHNPTENTQEVLSAFYGLETEGVAIRVGEVPIGRALTVEEVTALDKVVEGTVWSPSNRERSTPRGQLSTLGAALSRRGFTLRVVPEGRVEVVMTGEVRPSGGRDSYSGGYFISAVETRHILLNTGEDGRSYTLDYLLAPIRSWGGSGPIAVTVRYPSCWDFQGKLADDMAIQSFRESRAGAWLVEEADDVTTQRTTLNAEDAARLILVFSLEGSRFFNGGPLVGVGGVPGDGGGFAMRFGYEVAAPRWLLYAVDLDTDFTDRVVIAPRVEAATPLVWMLPSLGFGLGLPVRVLPGTQVGVRLQASVFWPVFGFVTSVDIFPGVDTGSAEFVRVTLLAQFSL